MQRETNFKLNDVVLGQFFAVVFFSYYVKMNFILKILHFQKNVPNLFPLLLIPLHNLEKMSIGPKIAKVQD